MSHPHVTEERIEEAFLATGKGCVYRSIVDETEKALIDKALTYSRGEQLEAARWLGINRNTLRTKIRKFNINIEQFKI